MGDCYFVLEKANSGTESLGGEKKRKLRLLSGNEKRVLPFPLKEKKKGI